MAGKIVYLVTSGEHDDYREVAILETPELAAGLVAKIPDNEQPMVHPMPVLDYVPELVRTYRFTLTLSRTHGWRWGSYVNPDTRTPEAYREDEWDFNAPSMGPRVEVTPDRELSRGVVQQIRIYDQDEAAALALATAMLAELRSESGRGRE